MLGPVLLPGAAGTFELEVVDGEIATIRAIDAERPRLALPAFADLHLHADRAYAGGPRPPSSLADAVELVSEVKRASRRTRSTGGARRPPGRRDCRVRNEALRPDHW